ncbi:MAG: PEGA domain-containing protein [Leptospiraceae bacterium]|nr:PEGA domain-containing protein [Leptospiraceae bacterium]
MPLAVLLFVWLVSGPAGCSTVRELAQADPGEISFPEVTTRPFRELIQETKTDDYKLRAEPTRRIRLALVELNGDPLAKIAFARLKTLMRFDDVDLIVPPAAERARLNPPAQAAYEYLKKENIDAVAVFSLSRAGSSNGNGGNGGNSGNNGDASIQVRLYDPVNASVSGEYSVSGKVLERTVNPEHQSEVYRSGNVYYFVSQKSAPVIEFENPTREQMRSLIMKSVNGSLSVRSTSGETSVILLGPGGKVELGRAPVQSYELREGKYQIECRRLGHAVQKEEVIVRAGQTRNLMFTWPDDTDITALTVLSAPSGQRVSLDGVVRGNTPMYATDIQPGAYNMEISRLVEGKYVVTGEAYVEVPQGNRVFRSLFTNYLETFAGSLTESDYWVLAADEGNVAYAPDGGLAFRTDTRIPTWMGLLSRPFNAEPFRAALTVIQEQGNELFFGLYNPEGQSLLVKVNGSNYSVVQYVEGEQIGAVRHFTPTQSPNANQHVIAYEFEPESGNLEITLDGSTIYEHEGAGGPLAAGDATRFAILTRTTSADGRLLARQFSMRTGPGLYEE